MQTSFTDEQRADPKIAEAEAILRKCVHCGFCTATCPTFVLLGDERDSPRGRIYLIKEMLENDRPADAEVTRHVDRCLSCLSCMTTCPSGVDYMHLVDRARAHINDTYDRPWHDRLMRAVLAATVPNPGRFRLALTGARLARPFAGLAAKLPVIGGRAAAMLALAPGKLPAARPPASAPAAGPRRGRVALLNGCAQAVLAPSINAAAARLLARAGYEVVAAPGEQCCGSLVLHMGKEEAAKAAARINVDAWMAVLDNGGLDAVVITASGCGTTIKDYGHLLAGDPAYAAKAARISALAKDVSEVLATLDLGTPERRSAAVVAYHSACSMQHGQKIRLEPKALLARAGFAVKDVPEGHICCGSAGVYNILQPEIAGQLRERKRGNLAKTKAAIVATGNIGCIVQLADRPGETGRPVAHTVELLDWAYGGPEPASLAGRL